MEYNAVECCNTAAAHYDFQKLCRSAGLFIVPKGDCLWQ